MGNLEEKEDERTGQAEAKLFMEELCDPKLVYVYKIYTSKYLNSYSRFCVKNGAKVEVTGKLNTNVHHHHAKNWFRDYVEEYVLFTKYTERGRERKFSQTDHFSDMESD